jgi:hypothetical protein
MIECPLDRQPTPCTSVNELKTNFALVELLESYVKEAKAQSAAPKTVTIAQIVRQAPGMDMCAGGCKVHFLFFS